MRIINENLYEAVYDLSKYGEEVTDYNYSEQKKSDYVTKYLAPALVHANSGWYDLVYIVTETDNGSRFEWVGYVTSDKYVAKYISVTADSTSALAREVFNNID